LGITKGEGNKMITIIDVKQRIDFVSKFDTTEPKTVFVLRPLSGSELLEMSGSVENGEINITGRFMYSFLEKSIVEIKNGPEQMIVSEVIKGLSAGVISELVTLITKINHMTKDDEKN
jgi:hypothetical protein